MSTTSLIEFRNNIADSEHEFQNSWGGAARIWDSLFQAYIPKKHEYDNWMSAAEDKRLWSLGNDSRLKDCERLSLFFTYDNALVKNEDFKTMAAALREFVTLHPVPGKVDHLTAFADVFELSNAEAIGLHATSVCENPWHEWDSEKDESMPYDISKGEKHWFVFEEVTEVEAT